ncbi:MAG TPA: heparan N-sulfatase [Rhodopirellula sp.]|nr:heparan N-sulfatase [Rhodopirellula sp.]
MHHTLTLCTLMLFAVVSAQHPTDAAPPNILFAIADDLSYPHMGAYGTEWIETPAFDRVAREGLLFNRCYTPNAKCAPSRSCILTGRNSWQLEAAANHWCYFPAKFPSYVEILGKRGYATGMTGKGWAPGIALDKRGKRRQMTGKPYSQRKAKPPTTAISSNDYAANFRDFLDAVPNEQPFCFWYGATEPHRRYEYMSGVKQGKKKLSDIDQVPLFWPDNEVVRHDMLDYALEVEHFDHHLQRMLNDLESRGLLDNTLVVVTSDNGMPFPRVKGQEYEMSNHLPLAIMWANGIKHPGRTIDDLVSFIDLAPTYLEIAGVDWDDSGMASTPGKSLTPFFGELRKKPHRDFLLIGKERHDVGRPDDAGYPIRGIVQGPFLLIRNYKTDRWPAGPPLTGYLNTDGSPTKTEILTARRDGRDDAHWQLAFGFRPEYEMFNIETDRECLNNIADVARYAELRAQMEQTMSESLHTEGDPRVRGKGDLFDEYPYANVRERNFYRQYLDDPNSVSAGWVNPSDFEASGPQLP